MTLSTSTVTLAPGSSRTYTLAPGEAVTVATEPNCYVTVTETPDVISSADLDGQTNVRTSILQYKGEWTYGPYALGGTVVVDVSLAKSTSSVSVTLGSAAAAVVGAAGAVPQRDVTYIGCLGDSHINNGYFNSAVGTTSGGVWFDRTAADNFARGWGWPTWVGALSLQRVQIIKSWAVQTNGVLTAGSNPAGYPLSRQIDNMLADALFPRVNRVVINIGTNDNASSLSDWASALSVEIARIPRPVDLISIPPRSDATNTTAGGDGMQAWAWYLNANAIMRKIADASGGKVRYIETRSLLNTPTTVPDVWAANHSYDNIHETSNAAYEIADAYVNSLLPSINPSQLDVWPNNSSAASAGANNLIDQGFANPLFGTASGGSGTGTIAGSLTVTNIGTATHIGSVAANTIPGGTGNMQSIAITSNAAGDGVDVTGATMHAAGGIFLAEGDQAWAQALVRINSGGIYPRNLFFRLNAFNGSNWNALQWEYDAAKNLIALPLSATRTFLIRTPILTAPAGSITNIQMKFRPVFAASGSCTVDISQFECRRFRGGGLY